MSVLRRLRNLWRDDSLARDIDRELSFHVGERADELEAAGMNRRDAELEARRQFGNPTSLRERTRDADVLGWLGSLRDDARYALRGLRAAPGFAAVAILSLGLGIGANTAIFSLVNAVMLRSLPVRDPGALVRLSAPGRSQGERESAGAIFTNPIWEAVRSRTDGILRPFAYGSQRFDLSNGGVVRNAIGYWTSGGIFEVLGVGAAAGRLFTAADDVRGCAPVAVVSHGYATREFGGPASAVGRSMTLDGHPVTIIGVSEPSFTGVEVGSAPSIYIPLCARPILTGDPKVLELRGNWFLNIMGRLPEGGSLTALKARLAALAPEIYAATVPTHWDAKTQRQYLSRTLSAVDGSGGSSDVRASYSESLIVLLVVVGVVLLIACANVAHLLLARATARQREMAVRLAMGAGRGRLVRQLLTESLLLSGLGAAVGVLFARWASALLVEFLTTRREAVWLDLTPDLRVLGFTIGVAVVTGVLFGLVPAWRATRVDPQAAMKAQGRGLAQARLPISKVLVALQIALSLILVVGAGLLVGTFRRLVTLDPGFDRQGVLIATVDLSNTGLDSTGQRTMRSEILERLRAVPGVRAAGASYLSPISGSGWNDYVGTATDTGTADGNLVWFNSVSRGWFQTLGTTLRAGRDFTDGDRIGAPGVVIVNEAAARRFFPHGNAVGQTIRVRKMAGGYNPPLEIVGVVANARYIKLGEKDLVTAYLPMGQSEGGGAASSIRCAPPAIRWRWRQA